MYDPLLDKHTIVNAAYCDNYWFAHTRQDADFWPSTTATLATQQDIVVVGAGYTGFSAAETLARRYQRQVTLIDMNQLAWGCSSRNAGFVMKSTGRLGFQQWQQRFDLSIAKAVQSEYQRAHEQLLQRIHASPDQCSVQYGGYIKVAHRPQAVAGLRQQYQSLAQQQADVAWLDGNAIQRVLCSQQAHAGLHFRDCVGINPLQLAAADARACAAAGVNLVTGVQLQGWQQQGDGLRLATNVGAIDARQLLITSNAYSANRLHPSLYARSLPVLSSVIVTAPLNAQQQATIGLSPEHLIMDTRSLKYYYRLLPDGRLLFGGRGAIKGKDADKSRYAERLKHALNRVFPCLQQTAIEHFWSGWVSVSLDDYPRVFEADNNVFVSMGYCGAGVSFSHLAGQRLAQLAAGDKLPALPFYRTPLRRFPFARARRLGQWLYYHYGRWQDGDWH
ncbi:NAD(P)/FAD-dependent oxidoreductase [Idiomarina xiamenensis]|uniref:D-amino acid oxidase n=1 Tax=Idiomarina xiamenensis 10-D-4 TaxID=740709 RepID=K2L685_9GAMM|nr:FAD-dependent oxidoreductase [Idiomarina xiamenensis]EKE85285.1 D-amino acid oxidase [Idiomarina xiamenensis 10-D-4]